MNEYTDEQILKGISEEDIKKTLEVLKTINFRSAYGHNPSYCEATNTLIMLLDKDIEECYTQITPEQMLEAIIKSLKYAKKQFDELVDDKDDKDDKSTGKV
jgi:hypothetical protein